LDRPVGRILSEPSLVDPAVASARKAFSKWSALPVARRLVFARRFQSLLGGEHGDRLAFVISRETGKSLSESQAEVRSMAEKVDITAAEGMSLVEDRSFPLPDGTRGEIRHRSLGVAAVIGPFNVPGHLPNGQIVPALLSGNTVVFKPSEQTPFTGQVMAELWDKAGLPSGVFNLVQGDGAVGGKLSAHPDVNAVFFTGSVETGRRVSMACAADPSKLVALEMGGKNAALVLDDADLGVAVPAVVQGAFATAGQRCSCTSRVLVQRKIFRRFLDAFLPALDRVTVGYFTENRVMGPLIDGAAVDRFLGAQKTARRLGYETLREGRALSLSRRGRYVSPSVHLWEGVPKFSRPDYWDEELFAPDAAVYVLKDEEDMTGLHNASRFGLAAAVFTSSESRFRRVGGRLNAGVVHWNRSTAMSPGRLPFGGVKASGNHRPAGLYVPFACVSPVGSVLNPPKGRR
jgi:succinylglutamic semialdehyde dehydrogenase